MGNFVHPCEGELIIKSTNAKAAAAREHAPPAPRARPRRARRAQIPYFNARIFLENKSEIGKVDEIFGTIQEVRHALLAAPRAPPHGAATSPGVL
jgi:H/ACA ribonucleoprotein complex subunit 1